MGVLFHTHNLARKLRISRLYDKQNGSSIASQVLSQLHLSERCYSNRFLILLCSLLFFYCAGRFGFREFIAQLLTLNSFHSSLAMSSREAQWHTATNPKRTNKVRILDVWSGRSNKKRTMEIRKGGLCMGFFVSFIDQVCCEVFDHHFIFWTATK